MMLTIIKTGRESPVRIFIILKIKMISPSARLNSLSRLQNRGQLLLRLILKAVQRTLHHRIAPSAQNSLSPLLQNMLLRQMTQCDLEKGQKCLDPFIPMAESDLTESRITLFQAKNTHTKTLTIQQETSMVSILM